VKSQGAARWRSDPALGAVDPGLRGADRCPRGADPGVWDVDPGQRYADPGQRYAVRFSGLDLHIADSRVAVPIPTRAFQSHATAAEAAGTSLSAATKATERTQVSVEETL
jgi:hypothetical protein